MSLPCVNIYAHGPMPAIDDLFGSNEETEQFWIPSDMPKAYDTTSLCPITRQHCCLRQVYASANDPFLTRAVFDQPDPMIHPVSMNNILPQPPLFTLITPETFTPYQVFPTTPVTPTPSFSEFLTFDTLKPQTPATPIEACLSTPSRPTTPVSGVSDGRGDHEDLQMSPSAQQQRQFCRNHRKPNSNLRSATFKCKEPGCKSQFGRQEHLNRHMKSHTKEKPHACWVPGCQLAFGRRDNLKAHIKTHSKRGGRNRYVTTLDKTNADYNPEFRGQLTLEGRPIYGSKLEDSVAKSAPYWP